MREEEWRETPLTSETTDTDDTNSLSWSSTVPNQRREDGQTGAEHRCRILRSECLWDGKDVLVVGSDSRRVTTLGLDTVRELGVVSVDHLRAVVFVVVLASVAFQARVDLSSNTDPVADLELGNFVTDVSDFSDNLVAWANPVGTELAPTASDGVDVGTADTWV